MKYSNLYFRIAGSQAGLEEGANFFILGIPEPDAANYNDHRVRRAQSTGGQARHGFAVLTLSWSELPSLGAYNLNRIITTKEASDGVGNALIYVTTVIALATGEAPIWVDLSGRAHLPTWTPLGKGAGWVYAGATLTLNNCTILAQPSTVVTP